MKTKDAYRQGDVLIIPCDKIPEGLKKVAREDGRVVLAHGEATGHAHAIHNRGVTMFRANEGDGGAFLSVKGGADIVHEEHATVKLPPGMYRVQRQVEYTPEAVRNVAD